MTLVLVHHLRLTDAVKLAGTLEEAVVSYAFENPRVVGEYSPGTGISVDDYLKEFEANYGTQPEVSGLVVERPAGAHAESGAPPLVQTELGRDLPEFVAADVQYGGALAERLADANSAKDSAHQALPLLLPVDWRPDDANIVTGGTAPFFWEQYYWSDYGLYTLPNGIGLEFEVNLHNDSVAAPFNKRPFCNDIAYKLRFWAVNASYTWSASDVMGVPVGSLGAYADYNDVSDDCRTNSIAIGLRYPKNLDQYNGLSGLEVTISAPAGSTTSSAVSGNVQAVSDYYCSVSPGSSMALTDCMGITPIENVWVGSPVGEYNRATLGDYNGWTTPFRCWISSQKGTVPPVEYSCFV